MVVARQEIPFDGVLRFSTRSRRNRPRKNSEFGLDPLTVIERYSRRSSTTTSRPALIDDIQAALGAVSQGPGDGSFTTSAGDTGQRGPSGASGGEQ